MWGPHLLEHQRPQLILQQLGVVRDLLGNTTRTPQQQPPSEVHELEHSHEAGKPFAVTAWGAHGSAKGGGKGVLMLWGDQQITDSCHRKGGLK